MILCIDTATKEAGIGLLEAQRCVEFLALPTDRVSEKILETIDLILRRAQLEPRELKHIFVITGPGSFTSLRVGLTVANQFAHQLGIHITGIRSDEFFAARTDEKDFLYLQSMNQVEVYARGYGSATLRTDIDESFLNPANLPKKGVKYFDDTDWKWVVSGRQEYREKVWQMLKGK